MSGFAECRHCHRREPEEEAGEQGWEELDFGSWVCWRAGCRWAEEQGRRDDYLLEQGEEDWR